MGVPRRELKLVRLHSKCLYTRSRLICSGNPFCYSISLQQPLLSTFTSSIRIRTRGSTPPELTEIWGADAWHPRGLFSHCAANRWNKVVSLESESIWIHLGRKHSEKMINMRVSNSLPCLALSLFTSFLTLNFQSVSVLLFSSLWLCHGHCSLLRPLHLWLYIHILSKDIGNIYNHGGNQAPPNPCSVTIIKKSPASVPHVTLCTWVQISSQLGPDPRSQVTARYRSQMCICIVLCFCGFPCLHLTMQIFILNI